MIQRHAYLVIAHNEFNILSLLVDKLDDERNDIYVHIDKKVRVIPTLATSRSRLFVLDNRMDVKWGHVSQIEAEYLLFETALRNGPYSYYHLISGTHLPLKDQNSLHSFYDSVQGQEVMRLWLEDKGDYEFKLQKYHLFRSHEYGRNIFLNAFCHFMWLAALRIQKMIGLKRRKDECFVKTDNWVSLTNSAVTFLLENKRKILRKYAFSFCGDEYFVASELSACKDKFHIHDTPNLLYVEFDKANAKKISLSYYKRLVETDYLFARKFTK